MEITYSTLSPFSGSTSAAVGDAAGRLRDQFRQIQAKLNDSFSLGGQEASLEELREVLRDCGLSDWDGYDAESVSLESYEHAKRVILSLPFDLAQPEISADRSKCKRTRSVSVDARGSLPIVHSVVS